jgi:uncharacterized protein
MQFILLGYDDIDEGAPARRLAARGAHLARFNEMYEKGTFQYGVAILDEGGKMIGSMIVCDFPSRERLEEDWLKDEPYVIGGVWKRIEIRRAQAPAVLLKA